ncbi:hypothetical protein [Azohydromonas caseinilytica]|uniref:Uncharacterized protein n=1 Tax=Azohydromonas caseinilytica TaxID=2728836 RepID=A0A848FCD5_9BURK|nr:hypothetical protein [Azohydromonas caseinilytica]NML15621.1 hypothetical protein [Azohydromonas caseinilytica]
MLRRSLGVAAPVVLTLTSAPVSAGMCVTASSFVSAATFASRQPKGMDSSLCSGLSPTDWAYNTSWPMGVDRQTATFAEKLGSEPLSGFPAEATLLEILQQPASLEAHVAAVWLSAYRGGMPRPFEDGDAVKEVWVNIRNNGGFYRPMDLQLPPLTESGTLDWLATTWKQ